MPYIGNQPSESFTSFATQEFSTSATTSYTLDHAVTNENEIALFINNVRQQPGSGKAYTATGTALTLSAATASTDTMYCVFLGRALQTVTPATNSITAAMVGNDLISGKDALASEPADTDEFLVSDAGTLKRIDYSLIKAEGITMADMWRLTTDFSSGTGAFITSNLERADTDGWSVLGSGMSESSGVFTFPEAGYYLITYKTLMTHNASSTARSNGGSIFGTVDNSSYTEISRSQASFDNNTDGVAFNSTSTTILFDCVNTTNYKVKFDYFSSDGAITLKGSTSRQDTGMTFVRLAAT